MPSKDFHLKIFYNNIEKATVIHKNFYDYSKATPCYVRDKMCIICPIHGEFFQSLNAHVSNKTGCKKCGLESRRSLRTSNTGSFIEKSLKAHGSTYDYSLVEYTKNDIRVSIICNSHGIFRQTPNSHLAGHGCPKCSKERASLKLRKPLEKFIYDAIKTHGNFYDYSFVDYKTSKDKITILCPHHGMFEQLPDNHIRGKKCRRCSISKSKTEVLIEGILRSIGVDFEMYKTFSWCKNTETGSHMYYDFYIPEKNILIEYDGVQHYAPVTFGGKSKKEADMDHKSLVKRDKLKTRLAAKNNVSLYRISYKTRSKTSLELEILKILDK